MATSFLHTNMDFMEPSLKKRKRSHDEGDVGRSRVRIPFFAHAETPFRLDQGLKKKSSEALDEVMMSQESTSSSSAVPSHHDTQHVDFLLAPVETNSAQETQRDDNGEMAKDGELSIDEFASFWDEYLPNLLTTELDALGSEQETVEEEVLPPEPIMDRLPDELVARVGTFLNVGSLKTARLASRRFHKIMSRDEAGWSAHCERLWRRKVHINPTSGDCSEGNECDRKCAAPESSALQAYINSCVDARLRHEITPDEFVFDPTRGRTTVWDFRFKEAAGMEWTVYDPWYAGLPSRKMVFLPNGTVRQLVEEEDEITKELSYHYRLPFYDSTDPVGVEMNWRWVPQPLDFPVRRSPRVDEATAYVRITVAGRDVPTYIVHRSPTGNWGFVMENCWGIFGSFTLPRRKQHPLSSLAYFANMENVANVNDAILARNRRHLQYLARESVMEIPLHDDTDRGSSDQTAKRLWLRRRQSHVHDHKHDDLLDDASLSVTTRWQWREALLYNLGARRLPDGPPEGYRTGSRSGSKCEDDSWQTAVLLQRLVALGIPPSRLNALRAAL